MTEGGEEEGFRDLSHFLRAAGIDGYIKQYWTYRFTATQGWATLDGRVPDWASPS